ncbi:MAG: precorrin-6y C5,15-methyltransferase (decarboxylating) subunit CbiE [Planctomycetota bacterium]|jgi:precorrin-6y C5,15-methyltransferase (decarboxylating) CbiE subunit
MAVNHNRVFIVGCGPGTPEYITPAASKAVAETDSVMGAIRLLRLFPESATRQSPLPTAVEPAMEAIAEQLQVGSVAVLVSGDPGLFSLAKAIIARFGRGKCEVMPAVSSLQVAFARLGLDWADARIISAHGRIPQVSAQELSRSDKIGILGGTQQATFWVGRLAEELAATHGLFVCENLTLPEESVREVRPEELSLAGLSSLTLMILVRRSESAEERQVSDSTGA